jgi:hypothetical protein
MDSVLGLYEVLRTGQLITINLLGAINQQHIGLARLTNEREDGQRNIAVIGYSGEDNFSPMWISSDARGDDEVGFLSLEFHKDPPMRVPLPSLK